ncbi:hypothetical protein JQC91_02195 [Jannaschia sp. Os4]|uniref:hypothetical protein n=1 Tax=Jannaschia sp. Os4 TaxID=2807617 RepID=UPI001939678B|nr:hypothetical protein [Jannaschia sp. Os4]MBM2575104.1 hypothetical protein [Jannaschia sp. Os4]
MTRIRVLNATFAALVAAVATLTALPAPAAPDACGPRAAVVARLAERFGETRRALGLARAGIMEIFASDETGTWTVALTMPDGRTCLIASGRHWEERMDDLAHLADSEA